MASEHEEPRAEEAALAAVATVVEVAPSTPVFVSVLLTGEGGDGPGLSSKTDSLGVRLRGRRVRDVVPGSRAAREGVRVGDELVVAGGAPLVGMDADDVEATVLRLVRAVADSTGRVRAVEFVFRRGGGVDGEEGDDEDVESESDEADALALGRVEWCVWDADDAEEERDAVEEAPFEATLGEVDPGVGDEGRDRVGDDLGHSPALGRSHGRVDGGEGGGMGGDGGELDGEAMEEVLELTGTGEPAWASEEWLAALSADAATNDAREGGGEEEVEEAKEREEAGRVDEGEVEGQGQGQGEGGSGEGHREGKGEGQGERQGGSEEGVADDERL